MCPPAIGAQEFFATLTEVMAGTCCAMGNIPSITPAIRLTFQDSTKSAAGWRRSSLCYRSALIIRLRSETSTPAPPTLLAQEARAAGIQDRVLVLSEGVTQIFDKS